MGVCQSQEQISALQTHKRIEQVIEAERNQEITVLKLLLLGAAESGKSTTLKQMRILHEGGFSPEEVKQMRAVVFSNTIQGMYLMLSSMRKVNVLLTDPKLEDGAKLIMDLVAKQADADPPTPETISTLQSLWEDNAVKKIYKEKAIHQLLDSTEYFMNALERIGDANYIPTNEDILHTRVKTTGIVDVKFSVNEETEMRVIDVGGQRSERKKWISCFDDVAGIIFVVSLAGYDEVIAEDGMTNRILEAMRLFATICNNDYFVNSSMILFLNKTDIFQQKIQIVPLTVCFTEYTGENNFDSASDYVKERFIGLNKVPDKTVFVHKTCGTDSSQMHFVINACFDLLMQKNLRNCGLY